MLPLKYWKRKKRKYSIFIKLKKHNIVAKSKTKYTKDGVKVDNHYTKLSELSKSLLYKITRAKTLKQTEVTNLSYKITIQKYSYSPNSVSRSTVALCRCHRRLLGTFSASCHDGARLRSDRRNLSVLVRLLGRQGSRQEDRHHIQAFLRTTVLSGMHVVAK